MTTPQTSVTADRHAAPCPCGTGLTYAVCCGAVHDELLAGGPGATTAEALMRSRFSAFALGLTEYLLATWHPSTRPTDLDVDPATTWTRLRILDSTGGGPAEATGTVTFRAHFVHDGERGAQSETSRFVRDDGRWVYLDGAVG